jgi:transcriptional regulator with XRE-family HTH domain
LSIEIGKRLRYARESLGLTLDDVEASTRIQKKYLSAIENGQFDLLPGPIYVRSYIRSYAIAVGENAGALLSLLSTQANRNALATGNTRRNRLSLPSAEQKRYGSGNDELEFSLSSEAEREFSGSRTHEAGGRAYRSRSERLRKTNSYRAMGEHGDGVTEPNEAVDADLVQKREILSSRKPSLPENVPAPEELGIYSQEESPVLARRSSRSDYKKSDKKKGFSFGKFYTILLIVGAILLVIATASFMWFRMENASGSKPHMETAQAEMKEKKAAGDKKAILTPLYSSTYGTDHYELVNADRLQLKIKWLKEDGSGFEVRQQEVGSPVAKGEVNSGNQEFSQSFPAGIWLKLFKPNNISVTINNFPIKTDVYTNEKDIYISFVH